MKLVDPTIRIVAAGLTEGMARGFTGWNRTILERAGPVIDYLSIHWFGRICDPPR